MLQKSWGLFDQTLNNSGSHSGGLMGLFRLLPRRGQAVRW
jgi:hypothetical protein